MKQTITFFMLLLTFYSFSQKNEIIMLPGITTNEFYYDQSSVFQLKYERKLGNSMSFQTGLRYHSEINQNSFDGLSMWVQSAFNSYKLDATILIIPINNERFKLKAGLGLDMGSSNYYWAWKGVSQTERDFDDQNVLIWRNFTYWQYNIDKITDIGLHFVFQGNYYFKNNVFVTTQLLYNYVFDAEVSDTKYSHSLLRKSPLCISTGLGFNF